MLQNAYFLAKIGADTAENERSFAENLPKIGNYPTGRAPRVVTVPVPVPRAHALGLQRGCPRSRPRSETETGKQRAILLRRKG